MRVTQFTLYNNFLLNQQNDLSELNKIQTQIATGKKIQNLYDNPTVYTRYLKLDTEINSFTQIKDSANFALNFARESDTTMNDIVTSLTTFKTKLLNAANDTNNETSREAIASELKGLLEHLKDLANTSIDGKYIFSGSAFNKKPIDDNYHYQGNDKYVKAFLGAGVEREYNIPGSEIFFGRDNDYSKEITTNMPMYNQMKAHPEYVVRGADGKLYIDKHNPNPDAPNEVPVNEPITEDSQIRMLSGVEDIDNGNGNYTDGTSYFYVRGVDSDGNSFEKVLSLKNSQSVRDLLDDIGKLYGNTQNNKVVDVSLNNMGEIQIKDLKTGNLKTDFFIAASDKYDSNLSFEDNLKNIAKNGNYFMEFQKSNLNTIRDLSEVNASNSFFDNRVFKFANVFKIDGREAISQDTLDKVFGTKGVIEGSDDVGNADFVVLKGTSTNGSSVGPIALKIDNNTTMRDLMDKIKQNFGDVNVSLENGRLIVTDNSIDKTGTSKLSINITTYRDDDGDGVFNPNDDKTKIETMRRVDSINENEAYFEKSGNLLISNNPQITRDYRIYFKNNEKITEKIDEVRANEDTRVTDVIGDINMPQTLKIRYKDINGEFKTAQIKIDNNEVTFTADGNTYHVYDQNGNKTPAFDTITTSTQMDPTTCELCEKENVIKGFTYKQLSDVVSMIVSDNLPANDNANDYNAAVSKAREEIDSGLDNGKLYIKDKVNSNTKIDFAIYSPNGTMAFESNNAITVDSAENDFFGTLQKAIEAVENGNNFADGNSRDPRNFGIQGALKAIEHVMDRVRRSHAKIGAVSQEFQMTIDRVDMLKVNVQSLQSDNIDTDLGEAAMKLNSLQTTYQALLASISRVNNLTLLNYLR
ncbi:flagellar hook-associated protein FlgL [Caminibacter sp.]